MVGGRSAVEIAEEYVKGDGVRRQAGALWGARALRRLLPERTEQALALATSLEYPDLTIQVR